jgi:hypothetical protein
LGETDGRLVTGDTDSNAFGGGFDCLADDDWSGEFVGVGEYRERVGDGAIRAVVNVVGDVIVVGVCVVVVGVVVDGRVGVDVGDTVVDSMVVPDGIGAVDDGIGAVDDGVGVVDDGVGAVDDGERDVDDGGAPNIFVTFARTDSIVRAVRLEEAVTNGVMVCMRVGVDEDVNVDGTVVLPNRDKNAERAVATVRRSTRGGVRMAVSGAGGGFRQGRRGRLTAFGGVLGRLTFCGWGFELRLAARIKVFFRRVSDLGFGLPAGCVRFVRGR